MWDCVSNELQCMLYCNWAVANPSDAAEILEPDPSCRERLRFSRPGGVTVLLVINSVSFCAGTSRGHIALFDLNTRASEPIMSLAQRASRQWHVHSRPVTQLGFMRLVDGLSEPSEHSDLFIVVSASEDGSIAFMHSTMDTALRKLSLDSSAIISMDFSNLMLAVSYASGSLFVMEFGLRLPDSDDHGSYHLEVVSDALTLATSSNVMITPRTSRSAPHKHIGSVGLRWFPATTDAVRLNVDGLYTPCSHAFRLVTGELEGTIAIWSLKPISLVRTFRLNLSGLNPSSPLVSMDDRVAVWRPKISASKNAFHGNANEKTSLPTWTGYRHPSPVPRIFLLENGYLRVINPWTAKYERSVQLIPPSTALFQNTDNVSSSLLSAILKKWATELVPLGIAGPSYDPCPNDRCIFLPHTQPTVRPRPTSFYNGSFMVSVADHGHTLVIIPLTTLKTV
ncbi:hypothetical protein AHF37_02170 [Paragonimus kellicotti]|nr:hypothetical protein AHF37_02170 [Paragonimus kellicotti]